MIRARARGLAAAFTTQRVADLHQHSDDVSINVAQLEAADDARHGGAAVGSRFDDFAASPQRSQIESRDLAPEDERESALIQNVTPDNYTAVVRGKAETTGNGLVEVYNVQ